MWEPVRFDATFDDILTDLSFKVVASTPLLNKLVGTLEQMDGPKDLLKLLKSRLETGLLCSVCSPLRQPNYLLSEHEAID